jgi:hypothetical protein
MTAALIGAVLGSLALTAALGGILFWQLKRTASAQDRLLETVGDNAELKIQRAAAKVAIADKDRAINILTADRDRLQFALDTVEDQRDELLKEAFDSGDPGAVATAVRDALKRLLPVPKGEDLPDVP